MDERTARLYAAPPGEFVTARDALARELKASGQDAAAAEVKRLRRPTVSAWALNQLATRRGSDLDELLDIGRDLADAQRRAITEGDDGALHELARRRSRVVDRLVREARSLLRSQGGGASPAAASEISNTLLAAATDPEGARRLREGTLERPLPAPAGFGESLFAPLEEEPSRPARSRARGPEAGKGSKASARAATPAVPKAAVARQRARERTERARVDKLHAAARAAQERATRLGEQADRAEGEARAAQAEAERAAKAADRARRGADKAGREAETASKEAERQCARADRAEEQFARTFAEG